MLHLKIGLHSKKATKKNDELVIDSEVVAAVGLALHLHLAELADYERTISALHQVLPASSPWSTKIYNITPPPNKIPRR
ncbi:MAG: hypothetical protein WCO63_08740 [Bacteroidota bacterium]